MQLINFNIFEFMNNGATQAQLFFGIFLILLSILSIVLRKKAFDLEEKLDCDKFKKERSIHEFRVWLGIISFFLIGIWLIFKSLFN